MAEESKSGFFYGFIVVLVACLILMVFQGIYFSFGVFFKPLAGDFGWSRATTAGAFSLCTILHSFLFIFTGRLNDRFGSRLVVTGGGLLLGLGYILMSQISSIWQLYLFFGVIVAVGMSGGFVPLVSTVSRWFVKRRGLMSSIVLSGAGLGTLIMPFLANWLITNYDWRTTYIIAGSAALLIIIVGAQFLRRDPAQVGQLPDGVAEVAANSNKGVSGLSVREVLKVRQFWMLSTLSFCDGYFVFMILVHIVPHTTDLGIPEAAAAGVLATIGGTNVFGRVIGGFLADRLGSRPVLIISFVLTTLALSMLVVVSQLWAFYLFAFVTGLGYGGLVGVKPTIVAELFGVKAHGVIYGLNIFSSFTGGAIGAALAGRIFDVTGSYQIAFLTCITASIFALILAVLLKPTKTKKGGEYESQGSP